MKMSRLCAVSTAALLVAFSAQTMLSAQTRLTTVASAGERQPSLALDAPVVAFVALAAGQREVFTVSTSGGAVVQRTTGADVWVGNSIFDAWPSLSISDDGTRIAYWNATGVRVLDLVANTDTLVANANLLPYPQLSGDGTRVVYQAPVSGDHEVFVVSANGGAATQLTTTSGPGRRLPHVRGNTVVCQRLVAGAQELFGIDLGTQQVTGPHTTLSGYGNRYARIAPDASSVAYETVVNGIKEVSVALLPSFNFLIRTQGSLRGDRLPMPTEDGEVYLQANASNLDVGRFDSRFGIQPVLTTEPRGGYRRPSVDRHGTVFVYQAEHQGFSEVFLRRLCYPPQISTFGQHGTPSVGVLQDWSELDRCSFGLGLATGLVGGTPGVLLIGITQQAIALPNAPGNFLYLTPIASLGISLDAQGDILFSLPSPPALSGGAAFAQWALLDPPANGLGIVSSKGVRVQFQ